MATKPRRKIYIIDREVQGSLLRKIGLHWFVLYFANFALMIVWCRLFEMPDASWNSTFETCLQRYLPFVIVALALLPAFLWDTVRLTNRFAGPIRRLRVALAQAAQGKEVSPLRFRDDDYWREIARDFNSLTGAEPTRHPTS